MQKLIPAMGVMAVCGLAQAEIVHWSQLIGAQDADRQAPRWGGLTIDISGLSSNDFLGDPDNHVLSVFYGAGASITTIGWNVNLTTVGISWADEATITFNNTFSVSPGAGDAFTVSNMNYQGSASSSLVLGGDGLVHIELHEIGFDDNPDGPDAIYEAGSYIIIGNALPSPGALGVFGVAGLFGWRRRRHCGGIPVGR